jgi:hypothetical protein
MTQLFWQIYFCAMITVFILMPFISIDKNGNFKSPLDINIRDLILVGFVGCIPAINIMAAVVCILTIGANLVWDIFSGYWGDLSLRSIFKKGDH